MTQDSFLSHFQIVLFAFVAVAAAAPQDKPLVNILRQSFDQDDQGSYQYAYELDNGQKVKHTSFNYNIGITIYSIISDNSGTH